MKKLVVLTGAGISAESGISTFRDSDGLWEKHRIEDVATPAAFIKNPKLVLDFYNLRREKLKNVRPNSAHTILADLEQHYDITIITQNIDDLHERAGSSDVLHLHGELNKVKSSVDESYVIPWNKNLVIGDLCKHGSQLRPHVVWFGEAVPMIDPAIEIIKKADNIIIIGTSMQVYPAAALVSYAQSDIPIYYIDPNPSISFELKNLPNLKVIRKKATDGVYIVSELLKKKIDDES